MQIEICPDRELIALEGAEIIGGMRTPPSSREIASSWRSAAAERPGGRTMA
jgi:hypothetical protein